MRVLRFSRCGPPAEVLELAEMPARPAAPGEVRLSILATPVNPADLNFIEGTYGVKPELPATPGIEACGEVLESGDPAFAPGDRAIFLRRAPLWATEVAVGGGELLPVPRELDPLQAAMLKVNPATAWHLLHTLGPLPRGEWIVQNAANSAVGRAVIQLARSLGLRTLNIVRRPELVSELTALGGDAVLLDDRDMENAAAELCGGVPPRLGFNAVGGDSALRLMNALASGGTLVTYGAMGRKPLKVPNGLLIFKNLDLRGLWITRWIEAAPREELAATYARLAEEVLAGRLTMPVDSTHPLHDFPSALARLEAPDRSGKVLFTP